MLGDLAAAGVGLRECPNRARERSTIMLARSGTAKICVNYLLPCDWASIFNSPAFFLLHESTRSYYFQLVQGDPEQVVAVAHFSEIDAGHFRSPRRGTFASFEFHEPAGFELVEEFVAAVSTFLEARGAVMIELLEPPLAIASPTSSIITNVLCRAGFAIATPEIDYTLETTTSSFVQQCAYSVRKRIRKSHDARMATCQLDATDLESAYLVIERNRLTSGYPMTMSLQGLREMFLAFPERLTLFGVTHMGSLIASAICVRVLPQVLYVFYWGDLPGYESYSPVCLLAECLYDYARSESVKILDLGTATSEGVPNLGLATFKRRIGSNPSLKLRFIKCFA